MVKLITRIRKHERGLVTRDGDLEGVLGPGAHWLWSKLLLRQRLEVEVVNTLFTRFEHAMLDAMIDQPELRDALKVVELGDAERALVWKDGRLTWILGPGRHAFWRTPYNVQVEVFNVNDFHFKHPAIETVLALKDGNRWLQGVDVEAHEVVLLFRDGKLIETLREGRYVFWRGAGRVAWKSIDLREQLADVAGQEIMTSDKVTLRVNLLATWQVTDAAVAATVVSDYAQAVYREAQLALRAAVSARTLDALLADKEAIGEEVRAALAKRTAAFGATVRSIGLRDIVLPGEMKAILNQVIQAEKLAQANLIKRREETAAARSQANTAKLLAENPVLARFKELEMLQEILASAKATFVFGQGEITEQLRGLIRSEAAVK